MKVLVVKLSSLGDVLATTPIFRLLSKEHEVHHLVMSHCSVVTENNPSIKYQHKLEFIPSGNAVRDISNVLKAIVRLRRFNFDAAIILHRSFLLQLICKAAGIKSLYGFTSNLNIFYERHSQYRVDVNRTQQEVNLVRRCGFNISSPQRLEFYPSSSALPTNIENLLPDAFIACNPGGGNAHAPADNRIWSTHSYSRLISKSKYPFVLLGNGKSDEIKCREIIESGCKNKVINLVGKTTFSETAIILGRAKVFVGNDSSLMFLAAAMGAKSLGLYGPTQVNAAKPLGDSQFAIRGYTPCSPCYNPYDGVRGRMYTCESNVCMQNISVQTVHKKLVELASGEAET